MAVAMPGRQHFLGPLEDAGEGERVKRREDQHQTHQETEVADPVDDERLLAGRRRRGLGEPEGNQEERAQADELPAQEEHGEVAGQDQRQHRGGEQVEVGEEPGEARVAVHVADGVDVDQRPHPGDDQRHQGCERIPGDLETGTDRRHPFPQHRRGRRASLRRRTEGRHRERWRRNRRRPARRDIPPAAHRSAARRSEETRRPPAEGQ